MMREYVFPIGVDKNGKKFQWVEDWDVEDCSKCCFWEGRCMYKELNNNKKGECKGSGYFRRVVSI